MLAANEVTIVSGDGAGRYPHTPPFRPDSSPPELEHRVGSAREPNPVHALVRNTFLDMGLDAANADTSKWNPLSEIVQPGAKVVLKPNLVRDSHPEGGEYWALVTHPSVVRAVADYVALALDGRGQIIIGDAPVQITDFGTVLQRTGLLDVARDITDCWDIPVRVADFRLWTMSDHRSLARGHHLNGDEDGYRAVDVGTHSALVPLQPGAERFRVTCYDPDSMRNHHNNGRHEYMIAGAVLDADVVINLPKLKTHRKVGLTCALKNLVGINGHKDWLPHHRVGSIVEGGDEYQHRSRLKALQSRIDEDIYRHRGSRMNHLRRLSARVLARLSHHLAGDRFSEGSWYGNDTCWRMVLDLNRILLYADRAGQMTDTIQRRVVTIVDAIIAGEGEGPMRPGARPCNLVVASFNAAALDAVAATLIGFDYRKLRLIDSAFALEKWPLVRFSPQDIRVRCRDPRFAELRVGEPFEVLRFVPPVSWSGHVELDSQREPPSAGVS